MKLKDYQTYPATFEPCEVHGSSEGYRAVIHSDGLDLVTYGVNYDNTVKMAQALLTDMAHAMAFEDTIPGASTKASFLPEISADSSDADTTAITGAADTARTASACATATDNNLTSPDITASRHQSRHQKQAHHQLAAPNYVRTFDDTEIAQHPQHRQVDIELPLQTSYKIIIANTILQKRVTLGSLAETLGWTRSELEQKLDFYQDSKITELRSIINRLGVKLEENSAHAA